MKAQVYFGILWRIILLFGSAMLVSFYTPHLHTFFNDVKLTDPSGVFDREWDWSKAHYWFHIMCMLVFALSAINVIVQITNLVDKYYPESKESK